MLVWTRNPTFRRLGNIELQPVGGPLKTPALLCVFLLIWTLGCGDTAVDDEGPDVVSATLHQADLEFRLSGENPSTGNSPGEASFAVVRIRQNQLGDCLEPETVGEAANTFPLTDLQLAIDAAESAAIPRLEWSRGSDCAVAEPFITVVTPQPNRVEYVPTSELDSEAAEELRQLFVREAEAAQLAANEMPF